jgi:hypothetical protein
MKSTTTPDTIDHALALALAAGRAITRDLLIPLLALAVTLATLHRERSLPALPATTTAPAARLALPPATTAPVQPLQSLTVAQPLQSLTVAQPLQSLTVAQLRQLARQAGHTQLARSGRKAQLLQVLA